jgi:O-antigen/teichoic acid export membrane protein
MNNERRIGTILSYIIVISNILVGLIYVSLLIKYLSIEQYGLYRLIGSLMVYFTVLDFGISNVVIKYYNKYRLSGENEKANNVLAFSFIWICIVSVFILLISLFVYFHIGNIFSGSLTVSEIYEAKIIFLLLIFNVIITIFGNLLSAIITSYEKFIFLKSCLFMQVIFQPILVFIGIKIIPTAINVVLIQTLVNLLFIAVKLYFCFYKIRIKVKYYYFDKVIIREMGFLSVQIFLSSIVDQIFWQGNQIIVGSSLGTGEVAVYSIAVQIYMIYLTIGCVLQTMLSTKVFNMVEADRNNIEIYNLFVKVSRLQAILLLCILGGFIIFGEAFIQIWAGKKFLLSYKIALAIMIPFSISLIQSLGVIILQAKNRYLFRTIAYMFFGVINIVVNIFIIKLYGMVSIAIVTGLIYIFLDGFVMNMYYNFILKFNMIRYWQSIIRIILCVTIIIIINLILREWIEIKDIYTFFAGIFIYLAMYFFAMRYIVFNDYEIYLYKVFINKIKFLSINK